MSRSLVRRVRQHALSLGLVVSIAGHLIGVSVIGESHAAPPQKHASTQPHFVEIDEVPRPPKQPEPPDPEPAAPTEDAVSPSRHAVDVNPARSPMPQRPSPTPKSVPAQPPVLQGVTLSGDGADWASAQGNGQRIEAPIRRPSGPTGRVVPAEPAPRSTGRKAASKAPAEVPLRDLSKRPAAPSLDGRLRQYYPAAARDQQISGQAAVRARIGPSGRVTATRVVSESFNGFGPACQAALSGSKWSSPLDKRGRAVATWILYRCHFQLAR